MANTPIVSNLCGEYNAVDSKCISHKHCIFWNFNSKRNLIPWRIEQMPEIDELGENFKAADLFTQIDDDIVDFEMDPELEAKLNPKPVYKDNVVELKPKEDKK